MSEKRLSVAWIQMSLSAISLLATIVLAWSEGTAAPLAEQQPVCSSWESSNSANIYLLSPPIATVTLRPAEAHTDITLRGSATFSDPDGDPEGTSTYRWLVNGGQIADGEVPQSLLLPLDGSLLSTDGQTPIQNQSLAFVAGHFGQAVQTSQAADSRLAYAVPGNADPNEGSVEMWVNLAYDLDDSAYDDYPRLFSYFIDEEHQLYVEVNADRIIITSRNEGSYYGTWPDPPGWRVGEWHHLAATWSASANHLAVYYDCALAAEGDFPALAGSADRFHIGSAESWAVMDAAFDDVRLSRRPLSAAEIAATCSRGGPAPNDEVTLPPGQTAVGDVVTFELTPCDDTGACGTPSSASATITEPPLGPLEPAPGLLPSGTLSVTLSLTTTMPANCRWNEQPGTAYDEMPYDFQQGQGTTTHSTVVEGLSDLADRWFYVRCADLAQEAVALYSSRDPDAYERWTHLRVLGPWDGDYPRIANLWGTYDSGLGVGFFAGYDLFVLFGWGSQANQAAAIRAVNPNAKILLTQNATYGCPGSDPLTTEWWNSSPGDPGYNCLLRDSSGQVLTVDYWDHPMYNTTVPYCRTVLAQQSLEAFLSARPDKGDNLAYDGIYWDRLHGSISWLGDDIDSDLDGQPDEPATLDAVYQAGLEDFFTQVRARLPHAVLMGNDAIPEYASWLNGRLFEMELIFILEGYEWLNWDDVASRYRDWAGRGHMPRTTFIQSAPERLYPEKYTFRHVDQMPPAMEAEAAASYRHMRYGLITALMGDGLFSYDYGDELHGSLWWYDEFGALPDGQEVTLPPRGYLGQPIGGPMLLDDTLDTPNQVINGDFEDGLSSWDWWVDTDAGAAATFDVDATGGVSDTAAAHIAVTSAAESGSVEFRQSNIATVADQSYTLSFWARSNVSRTIDASIIKQAPPWTNYGFNVQAPVTPWWQHFHLADVADVTASDGKLEFLMGDVVGELWLDDVQLQEGALGVWARPFSGGLAVVNTTQEVQTVLLPDVHCKLNGRQAPLFQVRVDDDEAWASAGWSEQEASYSQFGATVQVTPASSRATLIYTPTLVYSGTYEVLAWVVPTETQSSAVSVVVHHAGGETETLLDETTGEVGWHSLGRYTFEAGKSNSVLLTATGDGTVVADALKWANTARYNDGSEVSQIALQPQDGIVLLSSCYTPAGQVYLPLIVRAR